MKWKLIFQNEFKSFLKSDKGLFFIQIILIFAWGYMFASNFRDLNTGIGVLWLVFFSVIVSSNFSNSTFISERMNGMLELLLVSGIPRKDILAGKVLFVFTLSAIMGILVYLVGLTVNNIAGFSFNGSKLQLFYKVLPVYMSACFFNTSTAAWLSVKLSNPRIMYFINLFIIVILASANAVMSELLNLSVYVFDLILILSGAMFYLLALKEYRSENVTKPLIF